MRLSPLNLSGLVARSRIGTSNAPMPDPKPTGRKTRNEAIKCWKCPVCEEVWDDEGEAETCCPVEDDEDDGPTPNDTSAACPICGDSAYDHETAANCCLSRDFDHWTRVRIARRVREGGQPWIEAIEAESK